MRPPTNVGLVRADQKELGEHNHGSKRHRQNQSDKNRASPDPFYEYRIRTAHRGALRHARAIAGLGPRARREQPVFRNHSSRRSPAWLFLDCRFRSAFRCAACVSNLCSKNTRRIGIGAVRMRCSSFWSTEPEYQKATLQTDKAVPRHGPIRKRITPVWVLSMEIRAAQPSRRGRGRGVS